MQRRSTTTLTLVVLAITLAGVASLGSPLWTALRPGVANRLRIVTVIVPLCTLGVLGAGAVALWVRRGLSARRGVESPFRSTLMRGLPPAAAGIAALSLLMIAGTNLGRSTSAEPAGAPGAYDESSSRSAPASTIVGWWDWLAGASSEVPDPEAPRGTEPSPADRFPPTFMLLAALAAVVAGGAAWQWHRTRSASARDAPKGPDHQAVHTSLVHIIDAMLADPDPNTAIRGAYARLLQTLDVCGTGRLDHEGPLEHLHRVLGTLRVSPEPLRELVELFEVARFSTHQLGPQHRDQALRALRAAAVDLQGARPARPDPGALRSAGAHT